MIAQSGRYCESCCDKERPVVECRGSLRPCPRKPSGRTSRPPPVLEGIIGTSGTNEPVHHTVRPARAAPAVGATGMVCTLADALSHAARWRRACRCMRMVPRLFEPRRSGSSACCSGERQASTAVTATDSHRGGIRRAAAARLPQPGATSRFLTLRAYCVRLRAAHVFIRQWKRK